MYFYVHVVHVNKTPREWHGDVVLVNVLSDIHHYQTYRSAANNTECVHTLWSALTLTQNSEIHRKKHKQSE